MSDFMWYAGGPQGAPGYYNNNVGYRDAQDINDMNYFGDDPFIENGGINLGGYGGPGSDDATVYIPGVGNVNLGGGGGGSIGGGGGGSSSGSSNKKVPPSLRAILSNPSNLALMALMTAAGAFPTNTDIATAGESHAKTSSNSTTSSNLKSTSDITSEGTSTTTPTMSPEETAFMQSLLQKYAGLGSLNLKPYAAQQAEAINKAANLQSQAAQNIMASRGLSTSPVSATTAANIDAQRFGNQINLQQSIPLLQRQLDMQMLQAGTNIFSALPKGSTSTQSQTQHGTTNQTGTSTTSGTSTTDETMKSTSAKRVGGGVAGGAAGAAAALIHSMP